MMDVEKVDAIAKIDVKLEITSPGYGQRVRLLSDFWDEARKSVLADFVSLLDSEIVKTADERMFKKHNLPFEFAPAIRGVLQGLKLRLEDGKG